MATENQHIQLTGGLARVHRQAREELEEELGYQPTHTRVYSHLVEHYDGDLDLPTTDDR